MAKVRRGYDRKIAISSYFVPGGDEETVWKYTLNELLRRIVMEIGSTIERTEIRDCKYTIELFLDESPFPRSYALPDAVKLEAIAFVVKTTPYLTEEEPEDDEHH